MIPPAALFFGLLATIALLTVYSTRSADADFAASCPECLT